MTLFELLLAAAEAGAESEPEVPCEDSNGVLLDRSSAFGYPQFPSPQGSSIPKTYGSATAWIVLRIGFEVTLQEASISREYMPKRECVPSYIGASYSRYNNSRVATKG